jgi:hypothetical protein
MSRRPRRGALRTFAIPAAIAALTLTGLIAGLLGDGVWDVIAWAGLAVPLVAMGYAFKHLTKVGASEASLPTVPRELRRGQSRPDESLP